MYFFRWWLGDTRKKSECFFIWAERSRTYGLLFKGQAAISLQYFYGRACELVMVRFLRRSTRILSEVSWITNERNTYLWRRCYSSNCWYKCVEFIIQRCCFFSCDTPHYFSVVNFVQQVLHEQFFAAVIKSTFDYQSTIVMYSFSEIRSASIKIEPPDDEPTCNGQSSQTLFAKGRPSIKEEKSSASCSTAVGQQAVSLVSKEAGYQVPSLGEISSETNVLSIQITDVQGTPCNKNGLKDDGRINQIEVHVNGLPKDQGNNEDMQPSFEFNRMEKVRIVEEHADVEQLSRMTSQDNWYQEQDVQGTPMNISNSQAGFSLPEARNQGEEIPSTLSHHPYRKTTKTSLSGFQMNNHHAVTSKVQHNGTLPGYNYDNSNDTNGTKMALIETVPLHHVSVQNPVTPSHMAQDNLRYQPIDHQSTVSYHDVQSPEDALRTPRYLQNCDAGTRQPMSANSGCNCCCHSPSQGGDSFFFPPFVAETQRPSVIMVPISWDNSASGISHVPLTVRTL